MVTASHFYGDGSHITGIPGYEVSNEVDNRIITSTGAATGNAEANLTFDGTNLLIASTGKLYLMVVYYL